MLVPRADRCPEWPGERPTPGRVGELDQHGTVAGVSPKRDSSARRNQTKGRPDPITFRTREQSRGDLVLATLSSPPGNTARGRLRELIAAVATIDSSAERTIDFRGLIRRCGDRTLAV